MTADPFVTTLAKHWIETYGSCHGTDEIEQSETNPFSAFHAIVKGDPIYAWDLILEVIQLDKAKRSLDILAAAHLEDFLSIHGEAMIDYISEDILRSNDIKEVLSGVNKSSVNDKVWSRIQALRASN